MSVVEIIAGALHFIRYNIFKALSISYKLIAGNIRASGTYCLILQNIINIIKADKQLRFDNNVEKIVLSFLLFTFHIFSLNVYLSHLTLSPSRFRLHPPAKRRKQ